MSNLRELYDFGIPVITAHRGASGIEPENTMRAFIRAVEIGADIVEFDVRATADGELVILHDHSLDRTTEGHGPVNGAPWSFVGALNASFWEGTHDQGRRLAAPLYDNVRVPLFEEAVAHLARRTCINIQVYVDTQEQLKRICEIYKQYSLYQSAFLMVADFETAWFVRETDPGILLCVGSHREDVERHKDFGGDFIQPWRALLNPEYDAKLRDSGLLSNVFFANTESDMRDVLSHGVSGFLTDRCDLAVALRKSLSAAARRRI